MCDVFFSTYDYTREEVEAVFKRGFQFSHIAETDIEKAFDDVSDDRVEPFEYRWPTQPRDPEDVYFVPWQVTAAHYKTSFTRRQWYREEQHFFDPVSMAMLLAHRHGTLCYMCCNPNASWCEQWPMVNAITFGNNGSNNYFLANICSECREIPHWNEKMFSEFFGREIRRARYGKRRSDFIDRLRSAPRLRIEPQRRRAA